MNTFSVQWPIPVLDSKVELTECKESHRIKVHGESIIDSAGFIAQFDPYSSEHHAHSYRVDGRVSLDV
jgi:hypothetical protein